jgi:UMP-CMP kinase
MATPQERKKLDAEAYLTKHGIHRLFESVTAELVRFAPTYPLPYLQERVPELRSGVRPEVSKPRVIAVLGGPGCGKSVACAHLAYNAGATILAPGELMRDEVRLGSDVGRKIAALLEAGTPITKEIIAELIKRRLEGAASSAASSSTGEHRVFVLDGYPRTIEQALHLHEHVAEVSLAVFIDATDAAMDTRMAGRCIGMPEDEDASATNRRAKIDRFRWEGNAVKELYAALGRLQIVDAGVEPKEMCYGAENAVRTA